MNASLYDEFERLSAAVVDGVATPDEIVRFNAILRDNPELAQVYLEQAHAHIWLECRVAGCVRAEKTTAPTTAGTRSDSGKRIGPGHPKRSRALFHACAAAAAVLLMVAGLRLVLAKIPARPATLSQSSPSARLPVTLLRQAGAEGLMLPRALPGYLMMKTGTASVRLASGVELSLLGPLVMEIRDAMQVRLDSGRMLADVPPAASGFTVQTRELELWDLGTVFGVTASSGVSDVFVFKGSVQVNEVGGAAVDLCEAGQGVRAVAGQRPHKVAADSPEAAALYRAVAGRQKALRDPAAALAASDRIATLWGERWLPRVMPPPPPPVPGLRGTAIGSRQSAIGSRQSAVSSRQSAIGNRQSAIGNQQPAISNHTTAAAVRPPQQKESEMRSMTNTVAALAAAVTMGAGAAWAAPLVTNVRMAQRAGTRVVDVLYDLAGEAAIVTLGIETNGVAIPDSAVTRLSGDVSVVVQPGLNKSIVWNAGADWPEHVTETAKARVTAWSVDAPPLYCAVNVTEGAAASSYPVTYYPSAEAVPEGVTNVAYKTNLILLRRVDPTGGVGFWMGSPANENFRNTARENQAQVFFNKGYYVGVYEVTQSQWQKVMNAWPSYWSLNDYRLTRPVENVSYYDVRENPDNTSISPNWPASDAVGADSFMGRLRVKTGLAGCDLPTEAQWEYACRAGTTGALNDGTVNLTVSENDPKMEALGRYKYNGGMIFALNEWRTPEVALGVDPSAVTTNYATTTVGSFAPNAWGLYDMHGNVWEWCLDYIKPVLDGGWNPKGPASGASGTTGERIRRGGSMGDDAQKCRSAFRYEDFPTLRYSTVGFRAVINLP